MKKIETEMKEKWNRNRIGIKKGKKIPDDFR